MAPELIVERQLRAPAPTRRRRAHRPGRAVSLTERLITDPVLAAAVVAAGLLRFVGLGVQSLWYDEYATTLVVDRPLSRLLPAVARQEGTPPLYYVLLWGWQRVVGSGDTSLRALSAVVGVAAVPVVYAIARELRLTRRVQRAAAVLVAVNPMLVWYSQEARAYALFLLAGALTLLFTARCIHGPRRPGTRDVVLWCVSCCVAIAVHYFAVPLVLAEAVALASARRDLRHHVALACAPLLLLVAACVPLAARQASTGNQAWIDDWPVHVRLGEAFHHFLIGPAPPHDLLWVPAAVLVAAGVVLVVACGDQRARGAAMLMGGIGLATMFLPVAAAYGGFDYFLERNVIVAIVPFSLVVAAGLGAPRARVFGAVGLACLTALSVAVVVAVAAKPALQRPDWRAVGQAVGDRPGTTLVLMSSDGVLGLPLLRYMDSPRVLRPDDQVTVSEIDVLSLGRAVRDAGVVCDWWVGRVCGLVHLGPDVPAPLASRFSLVEVRPAGQFLVTRYASERPVSLRPTDLFPSDRLGSTLFVLSPVAGG